MFNIFKKKPLELPPFEVLKNSNIKDKYIQRLALWDWIDNDMIHVFDNNEPIVITMDPWPQLIYIEADGQKTVADLINQIARKYGRNETIPIDLDSTIIDTINTLLEDKLIELSNENKILPYYLNLPKNKQNIKKANKLMLDDGFIEE